MNNYISEMQVDISQARIAGSKARDDVEKILDERGIIPIQIAVVQENRRKQKGVIKKLSIHQRVYEEWQEKTKHLSKGDVLFIQFPCVEHTLFLKYVLRNLKKRGVKTVLVIHDLEILRISKEKNTKLKKKIRLNIEEYSCLKEAGTIISHNPNMTTYLEKMGIQGGNIVTLGIFDYIIPKFTPKNNYDKDKVIIAGNLDKRKAGYIYDLPDKMKVELYGVNYTEARNEMITFHGSYPSNELPNMMEGGFGLVWDGISAKTCEGVYGNYLRINNPHKTSLYLASDIPVIIWKNAALAEFVVQNYCGVLVESLEEIPNILANLSEEEYRRLKLGAEKVGKQLREGKFTQKAIIQCLNKEIHE